MRGGVPVILALPYMLLGLVIIVAGVPGWLVYGRWLRCHDDSPSEALGSAFGAGVILIALSAFAAYLARVPGRLGYVAIYGVAVSCAASRGPRVRFVYFGPLLAFVLFLAFALTALMLLPGYEAAFTRDWSLYYPNADVYLGLQPPGDVTDPLALEYLVTRTPFFLLFNTFFLAARHSYAAYQVISLFLNGLAFWALYDLAGRLLDQRAARFCLSLAPLAPLILFGIIIPTPKFLAAFFVCVAALTYLRIRLVLDAPESFSRLIRMSVAAAAAHMSHPSALIYLAVFAVDQSVIALRRSDPIAWRRIAIAGTVALCITAPWFIWTIHTFGLRHVLTPTYGIAAQHLTTADYLTSRLHMLATTAIAPQSTIDALGAWLRHETDWHGVDNAMVRFYWETFFGGMTVTASVAGLVVGPRLVSGRGHRRLLACLMAGALGCLAVHLLVDLDGHAANMMSPLSLAWFVTVFGVLANTRSRLRTVVVGVICLESLWVFGLVIGVTKRQDHLFDYLSTSLDQRHAPWLCAVALVTIAAYWRLLLRPSGLWGHTAGEPRTLKGPGWFWA